GQGPNRSVRRARASGPPTEGERRQPRLISQVTGQKGGRRGATRPGRLPLFVVFGRRQAVGRRTALFKLHQELGARMVDFGGWDMPVQYSSQIGEHHAVRRAAGVFDVSHMCIVDLKGAKVRALLEQLLANDVTKLKTPGRALYSCMLNERGGVIDDLIVYYLAESSFRAVVNASTRDKDLLWIRRHAAPLGVEVAERTDLAMLAIQGPEARAKAAQLLGLVLEGRGVLRSHQRVLLPGGGEGEITSGTFSPTLERSIALARIPAGGVDAVQVDIRGKLLAARVVKPPFVRFGKSLIG